MAKIKEQFKNKTSGSITCVIRTDTYGSSLEFFIDLYNVAKEDFPKLSEKDVQIVQYGGRHYRGTFGIEFCMSEGTKIPDSYQEYSFLEQRL